MTVNPQSIVTMLLHYKYTNKVVVMDDSMLGTGQALLNLSFRPRAGIRGEGAVDSGLPQMTVNPQPIVTML